MSQGFAAIVTLKVRPEKLTEFKQRLGQIGEAMSQEEDFVHAWVHAVADDPSTLIIYEAWACSVAHFMDNHFKRPYRTDYEAELTSSLREERQIQIVDYVQSYPGRA